MTRSAVAPNLAAATPNEAAVATASADAPPAGERLTLGHPLDDECQNRRHDGTRPDAHGHQHGGER